MDVDEDSYLSFLNASPLVKTMWRLLHVCDNTYQSKKATHRVINQSCLCQACVLLLPLKGPRHRIKGPDAQ